MSGRRALLLLLLLAFVSFLAARPAEPETPDRASLVGLAGPRPFGIVRVDPVTLRPRRGPKVALEGHSFAWSFSPDRSRLAIGSDGSAELRLVDLRRMRVLGDVKLFRRGLVFASAWVTARRILAVVLTPGCCGVGETTVVAVDAAAQRVLWRRSLGGSLQAGGRFRRSLVLVLGPEGRSLGGSRLVVVGPAGLARSAPLPAIRAGSQPSGGRDRGRFAVRQWNPGLAIDGAGARAFVVQAGAPVAEVDLRTLRVREHALSQPISLLGRLRDWLEPRAQAKASDGPVREAVWLGRGLLAVTGSDYRAFVDAKGRQQETSIPAGLKLIDTRRWSVRTIDPRASRIDLAAGTLLAYGALWDSPSQQFRGAGLSGYALDGSRRFHLFGDRPVSAVVVLGRHVFAGGLLAQPRLIDARTGRIVRTIRTNVQLLVGDQPFWY